jgi:predicted nucleic acid-binding protein
VIRYVVDASVVVKWFLPEIYAEAAAFLQNSVYQLHAPTFFRLEVGNVLCKKIRRQELKKEEGDAILEELSHLPIQKHPDQRLFRPAYTLARQTHQSLYDCMYLALAETINGQVVTADRKFHTAITKGQYGQRVLWVEDLVI